MTVLVLLVSASMAYGQDSYNFANRELTISQLTIGAMTFSSVTVTVSSILGYTTAVPPYFLCDCYDPSTGQLTDAAVGADGRTYYNAVVTVSALDSVGSVSNADSYNGSLLTIPWVQVGDTVYANVTATVDSVVSVAGGMPNVVMDTYNPSTRELSIPAVQFGSNVYTNVVVNAGTVKSIGSSDTILYYFGGGADGANPTPGLIMDGAGNLYGMTTSGSPSYSPGTVFKLRPDGTKTILHTFERGTDGYLPQGGVVMDGSGNLYGATQGGGTSGNGTVFRLTSSGTYTILYSFGAPPDAKYPNSGLIMDGAGNLYGTSAEGGANVSGTIFKVTPSGDESVLYSFGVLLSSASDPWGGVVMDRAGNLYGVTQLGPSSDSFLPILYKLTSSGTGTVFNFFNNSADGIAPDPDVSIDAAGNLYGTTSQGGAYGQGVLYKITPSGSRSVLHSFSAHSQIGYDGFSHLWLDSAGIIYGAEVACCGPGGSIFKVSPSGEDSVLYAFSSDNADGGAPELGFVDSVGNIYGTTNYGGPSGSGTVFKIKIY